MRRSVRAEEASPGLDLRVMITPADCICSSRAGFNAPGSHIQEVAAISFKLD